MIKQGFDNIDRLVLGLILLGIATLQFATWHRVEMLKDSLEPTDTNVERRCSAPMYDFEENDYSYKRPIALRF